MRTSERRDSNGRPLATIIITTKGGEQHPCVKIRRYLEFKGSSTLVEVRWNSCLSAGEENINLSIYKYWELDGKLFCGCVQVSCVLDGDLCPRRRGNQVARNRTTKE